MDVVEICRDPALVFAAYEAVLREAEGSPAFARLLRTRRSQGAGGCGCTPETAAPCAHQHGRQANASRD